MDIKIAFTENEGNLGMYHEKMGIISDDDGNKVAFLGSMNESATAMMINYEAIDVFCSWEDEKVRVTAKENNLYVSLINPFLMKEYRCRGLCKVKTDRLDAKLIANYGIDNWYRLDNCEFIEETYQELKLLGR
ncbi:MAG TPA: transposase [Ruminiclostridium sp.]|nr:transposase [Ruminiclostridium sp.]